MQHVWQPALGAVYLGEGRCRFRVWAPFAGQVEVELRGGRRAALQRNEEGYHEAVLEGIEPGTLYLYRLDVTASCRIPPPAASPKECTARRGWSRSGRPRPAAGAASPWRTTSSTSCTSGPSPPRGPSTR